MAARRKWVVGSIVLAWLLALLSVLALNTVSATEFAAGQEEIVIVADEHADFSKVFEKTGNISLTSSSPERYGGDASRFYKTSHDEAYFIYQSPNEGRDWFTAFRVVTWYHSGASLPGDMSFELSADHVTYSPAANVVKQVNADPPVGGWRKVTWEAESLPAGTRYIKIIFGDTVDHPSSWAIQIGRTELVVHDQSRQALLDEIASAEAFLASAVIGTQPGTYPQSAADQFSAAIAAAQAVADNPNAGISELEQALADLAQARAVFEQSVIRKLNWPQGAAITAVSAELDSLTVTWPHVAERSEYPDVVYHVFMNGTEVSAVPENSASFADLRPQMEYEFQVVAVSGGDSSAVLGPFAISTAPLAPVPAPDFSQIEADDFADEDFIAPKVWVNDARGIPYYYYHFHKVANAVRLEEPYRGFIDIIVHRNPNDNQPYNARVQENYLWFAYFYTNPAPWNMYYGMPEVKYRLEEVLEHLLTLQGPQGTFSEYGWERYNLPGTTFALQFLGQTIRLLNEAKDADPSFPFIRQELYDRVAEAMRKAFMQVLNDESLWNHGKSYTNQYTLIWSAAAAYLDYFPDPEIDQRMRQRFAQAASELISPAGFYYEADGYDMGYNLGVHLQNDMAGYHYFRDTDMEQPFLQKESAFFEWLSYNLVMEPDGSHFTSNAAPSLRTGSSHIDRKDIPLSEKLPLARAFVRTQEEIAAEIAKARNDIVKDGIWPNVPNMPLTGGNAYNPYGLYNRILYRYHPTESERAAAIQMLPYFASERFNHQRADDRSSMEFTYVRRPDYYAAFNAGPRRVNQQVFGLGLLWHPEGGIMMSSQTENSSASSNRGLSWGTKPASGGRVYENGDVLPSYKLNGQSFQPAVGAADLANGDLEMSYSLGSAGTKTVAFTETGVTVTVYHQGEFEERIPLAIGPEDIVDIEDGMIAVTRGNARLEIAFEGQRQAVQANVAAQSYKIFDYRIHMLTLKTSGSLHYTMTMSSLPELAQAELSAEPQAVVPGGTSSVRVSGWHEDGTEADLSQAVVSYAVSHPDLAVIDPNGTVTLAAEQELGEVRAIRIWAEVTLHGKTLTTEEIELHVAVTLPLLQAMIQRYTDQGELETPLASQLANRLEQAGHHQQNGRLSQAIKHIADFQKHLQNEAMHRFVSAQAKDQLLSDSDALLDSWQGTESP